jgi:tetratricopeptide (TPR) repeat protein
MSLPQRTFRRDILVFISAVTRDLASIRLLVKKGLEVNQYFVVEEDTFPPDYRDMIDTLRVKIDKCDAMVHIAGHCYGSEPQQRPDDAPRRSFTQLEYDIAVKLGKPVYVFLTGEGFPADPHEPEPAELGELQQAHRRRLTSTDRVYTGTASSQDLDQKIRILPIREEVFKEELQRHGRWAAVAVVGVAMLGMVANEYRVRKQERANQERERLAAEASLNKALEVKQVQQEFAERFLQQLLTNKEITAEEARQRALKELPALVKLPLEEIKSLIDREIPPLSPLDEARDKLLKRDYEGVIQVADQQKPKDFELAMLVGTAALALFRQSPGPEWNERALSAFRRAMALADPNSPSERRAWAEAAVSAASVLRDLARYAEAEPLLRDGLRLHEADGGPNSPGVATVISNLAWLLQATGRLSEAEPLVRRSLAIDERSYGPDHPEVATDLNNLAGLLTSTNRLSEAEPLFRRSLAIDERSYGPDHPEVARDLNNLAELLRATNRLWEAEPLFRRALAIAERSDGPDLPTVAVYLNNLALLVQATGRLSEAEPLYRRALAIDERSYGPDHPDVARALNNLALLLKATGRLSEAEPLYRRALAIDERSYGPDHPDVAQPLNNLAVLLEATDRLSEAEPLYRRALAIWERSYGPDHPDVATSLNNLAELLQATDRLSEAEPLYRRALAIDERSYGPDHPAVARDLNNLAGLLGATDRLSEAEPLMARVVSVLARFQRATGHKHPNQAIATESYRKLLSVLKLSGPEVAARMKAASEGRDKLSPIAPEVECLLGPARPVADVLASLDRQYKEQGKPAVYFLGPGEPIAPHLDGLLRPDADGLTARGLAASRRDDHADAIVLFEAALALMADDPSQAPVKLVTRMIRAVALRELGLVAPARDELSELLPDLDKLPASYAFTKGLARYHLALCQWRLGDLAAARRSAEESLTAYDGAPEGEPVNLGTRRRSEALLASLKDGKAPPPAAAVDAPAALEAARARYKAREALTRLPLDEKAAPLLDQLLGPARPTKEVLDALDRQYREQGKPAIWFLPLNEPFAPHLDELLSKPSK